MELFWTLESIEDRDNIYDHIEADMFSKLAIMDGISQIRAQVRNRRAAIFGVDMIGFASQPRQPTSYRGARHRER